MAWNIFAHHNNFVSEDMVEIAEIPCIKIRPKASEGILPTVIFYHGWHSKKDFQRFKGAILGCYGYQVIIPDALYHGERGWIDYDAPGVLDEFFWKIVFKNVEESRRLVNELIMDHQADSERIGVVGSSMGGFSAAGVFAVNPKIRCLITLNGACAWVKAEEIFRKLAGQEPATLEDIEKLAKYDPLNLLQNLQQRPILMLHGDADTSVPVDIQRYFYQQVLPLYSDRPESLKLIEVARLDHYVTTGMMENTIEWLKQYL